MEREIEKMLKPSYYKPTTIVRTKCRCSICGAIFTEDLEQWQLKDLASIPSAFSPEGYLKAACIECYKPHALDWSKV